MGVGDVIHAYECKRHGAESKHGREPDGAFYPLQPYAEKSEFAAERLTYPAEHTALLIGEEGSEFRCDERNRDKENESGEKIIECRTHAIFGFGREPS